MIIKDKIRYYQRNPDFNLLKEIYDEEGLPIRIQMYISDGEDAIKFIETGPFLDPNHFLTSRGVKLYADGAIGSRGAAFFENMMIMRLKA